MANEKRNEGSAAEPMGDVRPSKAKRAVKAGVILAAAGLTALAISRRMKSRKGKAAGKKPTAKAKVKRAVRKVKSKASTAMRRATAGGRSSSAR